MFNSFPKKLLLFGLVAVFMLVFSAAKKESAKNENIYSEMDRLEGQAKNLANEKQNLSNLIAFFDTESYKDREAKKQLGLQNPGEKVIVITREKTETTLIQDVPTKKKESNFNKWINFIFKSTQIDAN